MPSGPAPTGPKPTTFRVCRSTATTWLVPLSGHVRHVGDGVEGDPLGSGLRCPPGSRRPADPLHRGEVDPGQLAARLQVVHPDVVAHRVADHRQRARAVDADAIGGAESLERVDRRAATTVDHRDGVRCCSRTHTCTPPGVTAMPSSIGAAGYVRTCDARRGRTPSPCRRGCCPVQARRPSRCAATMCEPRPFVASAVSTTPAGEIHDEQALRRLARHGELPFPTNTTPWGRWILAQVDRACTAGVAAGSRSR